MAGLEYVAHEIKTGLGYYKMLFSATPFEGNPAVAPFESYGYGGAGRRDMRWLSSQTTGNGWEHTFEIVGNKYRRDTVFAGRACGINLKQFANTNLAIGEGGFLTPGYSERTDYIHAIIKDEGGVNTQFLAPGVQKNTIVAATPDYFLAKQRTPRLPYLLQAVAAKERQKWATEMVHTQASVGFPPTTGEDGSAGFTGDPLAGFGKYVDETTLSYDADLLPLAANENHFLVNLSVIYILKEYFSNHVRVNGRPIGQVFDIEITPDAESQLVSLDIGDGSPHAAVLSALREGNFRYWWDYRCGMHVIPDYCNPGSNIGTTTPVYGILTLDRLPGVGFNMSPGPRSDLGYPRVNRVYVEGQWSSPVLAGDVTVETNPLKNWKIAPNKATYPPGQTIGTGGEDVSIKGAHISDPAHFARSEYNRLSQRNRVTLSGFPYVGWALGSYNRVIQLIFPDDPQGSFQGIGEGGTFGYYSVEAVSVEVQGADEPGGGGGYPECTLVLQEIVTNDD